MIKQTLYFTRPAYLSLYLDQLKIELKGEAAMSVQTRPIEDLGMVVLEHPQITITHGLARKLMAEKVVLVSCDEQHMPNAFMLPGDGHTLATRYVAAQLEGTTPLKKYLWQQTIIAKVYNQSRVLIHAGLPAKRLQLLVNRVSSGDSENVEAQAAAYYWPTLMHPEWCRDRYGEPPNNLLNYGYAILRAMVARALVSSGLLLISGIHHRNQYNPFCLADDIMEPYRPYVDRIVYDLWRASPEIGFDISREQKEAILAMATTDVMINGKRRPLMVALSITSASLVQCFTGEKKKILYPKME